MGNAAPLSGPDFKLGIDEAVLGAPALNPIGRFKLERSRGKVRVTGKQEASVCSRC
jgi:hypothetical protein